MSRVTYSREGIKKERKYGGKKRIYNEINNTCLKQKGEERKESQLIIIMIIERDVIVRRQS